MRKKTTSNGLRTMNRIPVPRVTRSLAGARTLKRFFYLLNVHCSLLIAVSAVAQVRGTIFGPGVKQFPIAISPLKNLSASDGQGASEFATVLARDLQLSGLFRVIPRDAYIEPPDTSGVTAETINFDNWSVVGALALVKGTLERQSDEIVIEARLFDVSQRQQLAGRRYRGEPHDLRRMAHRFADEIMAALTGERGPFDSRIAFLSTRGGRFKDVYVMSPAGGDVRRITSENTLNLSPSWGPDAESLLLTSYRNGNPDLFALDLTSLGWQLLSGVRGLNLGGQWSPDGRRLAAALEYDGSAEIALLNQDGSLERRLTNHWSIDVSPSWSPDGRQIAFCSNRSGNPQIYIMDLHSGSLRRVTSVGNYNTSPSWSPQGDQLAYTSRVSGRFQIFTVDVNGQDVRQVTESPGDNEDPSWSPDGRYLVFSSTRSGPARLYLTDQAGVNQIELTVGQGSDTSPTWSGWLD